MEYNSIKLKKITRIAMICTGNICRSPMAWGIGLREAKKRRMAVEIDSAGTGACIGCGPSANSLAACAQIGIDLSAHIAKQADSSLYTPETLFVVMTAAHADWLCAAAGIPAENIVILGRGVPDPYGGSLEIYCNARDAIEEALIRLFDQIEPLTEHRTENEHSTGLVIRPAEMGDIDTVAAIEKECFTDPWTADGFLRELSNETSDFAVAVLDGTVCGYGILYSVWGVSEIPKLCVSPQTRRRGIAREMLARLERRAIEQGSTELTLEVRKSNNAARELYASFGFEFVGIRPDFYSAPHEDAVIMTKQLKGQDQN